MRDSTCTIRLLMLQQSGRQAHSHRSKEMAASSLCGHSKVDKVLSHCLQSQQWNDRNWCVLTAMPFGPGDPQGTQILVRNQALSSSNKEDDEYILVRQREMALRKQSVITMSPNLEKYDHSSASPSKASKSRWSSLWGRIDERFRRSSRSNCRLDL